MLTVKQINEVSFGKAGFSGYKPEDVDNFIDEVSSSFEQLLAERDDAAAQVKALTEENEELARKNEEMREKLTILAKEVEGYRADEDGIKEALVSAQRVAKASLKEANEKADLIVHDAEEQSRRMMENARIEAARAAKEYMAQADLKREELEETKRQVSSFRASLLEMYKKHLELINHIPNFRQKDEVGSEDTEPEASYLTEPETMPEPEPEPAPVKAAEPEPEPAPKQEPKPQPAAQQQRSKAEGKASGTGSRKPSLHEKTDFTKEDSFLDGDLSDVGIDLKTYSDIPETLQREKSSHFSNLEFGDDVDLGVKKRRK